MLYLKAMKNIMPRSNRGNFLVMAVLLSVFALGGTGLVQAHDGYQGRNGYNRGGGGGYHHYGYRNHHRGYWNQQNGTRLWINVG